MHRSYANSGPFYVRDFNIGKFGICGKVMEGSGEGGGCVLDPIPLGY